MIKKLLLQGYRTEFIVFEAVTTPLIRCVRMIVKRIKLKNLTTTHAIGNESSKI